MGLYDNFILPSGDEYISTYAGVPIAETRSLGQKIGQEYERGLQGVSAYNVMRNNTKVLDADQGLKDRIFGDSYKMLEGYVQEGNYENAVPAVMTATNIVTGDKGLQRAMSDFKKVEGFQQNLDKLRQQNKIEQWQHDKALNDLQGYQGQDLGDDISKYIRLPANPINIEKRMTDAAKDVRPETRLGPLKWDSRLGKFAQKTIKQYDKNEIEAALAQSLNDPAAQQYLNDMREYYGDEAVDEILNNHALEIRNGLLARDESIKYIGPSDGFGPGAQKDDFRSTGFNRLGAPERTEGVDRINIAPDIAIGGRTLTTDEAISQEELEKAKGIMGVANSAMFLESIRENKSNLSLKEREQIRKENDKASSEATGAFAPLTRAFYSLSNWWNDVPSKEDMVVVNKASDAVKRIEGISDQEWDNLPENVQEDKIAGFFENEGRGFFGLNVEDFNARDEVLFEHTKKNPTQQQMSTAIHDDISRHAGSRVIFDRNEGKKTSIKDDDALRKALNGEEGSFVVLGQSSNKTPYALENPALASSYVVRVTDDEGNNKEYVVSKSAGYLKSPNIDIRNGYGINVSNEDYNSTVAEVYSSFPVTEYEETFTKHGVSFDGRKQQGVNPDGSSNIVIKNFTKNGEPIDLGRLAGGLSTRFPRIQYNAERNELSNMTPDMIAQLLLFTASVGN